MKKYAEDLAKDYDFTDESEYFNYIIESLINGQRQQVRSLFNDMHNCDKERFLVDFINPSKGIEKSVLNICIAELCK
jgi:ADP-ribosylglycohydrolase